MVPQPDLPAVLALSFDGFPGVNAAAIHLSALLQPLARYTAVDALYPKGTHQPHIEQVGRVRVMRVPVGEDPEQRVAAFHRAVARQLDSEAYGALLCTDAISLRAVCASEPVAGVYTLLDTIGLPADLAPMTSPKARPTLSRCALVIAHAPAQVDLLRDAGVAPERIVVAPCGIDTSIFSPPKVEVRGDPSLCRVAVPVSSLQDPLLGEVMHAISLARVPIMLRVLGIELETSQLAGRAEALGIADRVELGLLDTTQELAIALADVDVVIVDASVRAPPPVLALAAAACGRAVVLRDGPLAAMLTDTALAFEAYARDQPEQLAIHLQRLATDPEHRQRLGARARESVLDAHDIALAVPPYRAGLERLWGRTLTPLQVQDDLASSLVRTAVRRNASAAEDEATTPRAPVFQAELPTGPILVPDRARRGPGVVSQDILEHVEALEARQSEWSPDTAEERTHPAAAVIPEPIFKSLDLFDAIPEISPTADTTVTDREPDSDLADEEATARVDIGEFDPRD